MSVFDTLSLVVSAAGLIAAMVGVATQHRPHDGLVMMLDLWVAAVLLQLVGDPDWRRLLATALLIVVRKVVSRTLIGKT